MIGLIAGTAVTLTRGSAATDVTLVTAVADVTVTAVTSG